MLLVVVTPLIEVVVVATSIGKDEELGSDTRSGNAYIDKIESVNAKASSTAIFATSIFSYIVVVAVKSNILIFGSVAVTFSAIALSAILSVLSVILLKVQFSFLS